MSLTVEKLNDDTTFLLAFAPSFAPKTCIGRRFPGAFTILVDPWLDGTSSILHQRFQVSRHTSALAVKSLAELEHQPDVIIISQDKPDHCHQPTLCTLPRDTRTRILATPAAAKKIKSWKYFQPDIIHVMKPYHPAKPGVVTRIRLEPYSSSCSAGEITIANLATKYDLTGLHNAIGITYRPPGSVLSTRGGDTVSLSNLVRPSTAPNRLSKKRSAVTLPDTFTGHDASSRKRERSASSPRGRPVFLDPLGRSHDTPSASDLATSDSRGYESGLQTRKPKEKPLSVIYTPHGVSTTTLQPYLSNHLERIGALPLTALLHCMNTEENPWFMGGMVANGAPGGVDIATETEARYWISAHDEIKDVKGASVVWLKSTRYTREQVMALLWERESQTDRKRKDGTEVRALGVGERMRIDG